MTLTQILSVQAAFVALGLLVMRAQSYGSRFLWSDAPSPGAYALVCPGVAMSVMLHFWINKGLVAAGVIAKFGIAFWSLTALAVVLQVGMIALVLYLNRRHFGRSQPGYAVPAE